MRPEFFEIQCGPADIQVLAQRHAHAKYCYFGSKGCRPPPELHWDSDLETWAETGNEVGHANATDEQIQQMMLAHCHWVQVVGVASADPALHGYVRCECFDWKHKEVLRNASQ